jgi:hypothetical protein
LISSGSPVISRRLKAMSSAKLMEAKVPLKGGLKGRRREA